MAVDPRPWAPMPRRSSFWYRDHVAASLSLLLGLRGGRPEAETLFAVLGTKRYGHHAWSPLRHSSDDSLTAVVNMDVFDPDKLVPPRRMRRRAATWAA